MAETAAAAPSKKKKTIIIVVVVISILLVIAGIYIFSKAKAPSTTTDTKVTDNKGGLSSLLGSLNLSGLTLF